MPATERAVAQFARVTAPGRTVAGYVWDYREGMGMLRRFRDTAVALDPGCVGLDEDVRSPQGEPEALQALWAVAGLAEIEARRC